MILKKPYAFFIKMFKPIHLILSILVLYLISLSNDILRFLNNYMYSSESVVAEEIIESLINNSFYFIPVAMIILFLILLSVMYKKNKPVIFYFVGIFSFIIVLVINIYTINFLNILVENIVSIKAIKLIHDLVLINMLIESGCLVFLFVRGVGIDFKKFDFNSDISQFEMNESDKEEFEVNVNIDFNERKRKRKESFRNLKYLYIENKLIINIFIIIALLLLSIETIYFVKKYNEVNKENVYYSTDLFTFKVNSTTLLNTDFQGNRITENYLLIVDANIKPRYSNQKLYLNDFSLRVENFLFKPIEKYYDKLIDLGNLYQEQILDMGYTDYLFVFEIPEKYISSDMSFRYTSEGNIISVSLNPKVLSETENILETKEISQTLKFEEPLNEIQFKINSYELKNSFLINYNYCIKENDCISSKEYLKPSIDENYDKTILKLDVEYIENSKLDIKNFYSLLSNFGIITYKIDNKWINTYKFEEIVSKKVSSKNNIYIGVNSNILNAEAIKLIFNVRGQKYEYILK